jgi:hypothetical protein
MYRFHLARNLRSLTFLLIAATVLAAIGTLWWANRTGLPESWRDAIEREVSKQGAYVKIGSLRYHPLRGVVASKIRVFSDPLFHHEISRLEQVVLNFDKTKLTRGIIHLTKIELIDADLVLPLDPTKPDGEVLNISRANGVVFIPGGRRIEIRNATGFIAGIQVSLNARLIGYQQQEKNPPDEGQLGKRRLMIARIIGEINKWSFDKESPPHLRIFLDGDANSPSSIVAKLSLLATDIGKNQHNLDEFAASAEITGDLLTVTSLHAKDSRGTLEGRVDYDLSERNGRFDLHSSLEITPLLKAWLDVPPLRDILIGGRQTIDAEGEFHIDENNAPQFQMTGHACCDSVLLRGVQFDTLESSFAWRDNDLFLRDVHLRRPDGEATGKAMIQWPLVRLALDSTLPEQLFKPFFIGKPLEHVIGDFTDHKDARIHVKIEGGFDANDHTSWVYTGSGSVENVSYKGVPIQHADCNFSLSHHELDFYDGTVDFNYQDYPLRKAFSGPKQGTAKIGRIRYDAPEKSVFVENVTGNIWAAPLVRLFAPKVADSLEQYRFHEPPDLKGSGVVDVTPQGRTSLDISFQTGGEADYRFLGENLTLSAASGTVKIRNQRVTIGDLKLNTFDGPIAAQFDFLGNGKLTGEMNWTRLSIPALTSTYGFEIKGGGQLTGRIEFDLTDGKVETMNGIGLFALEKTELFSVPMFGPLSPLIGGILGDRRAGFERAKNAFCNFNIKDGILSTGNFSTSTTSLVFAGEGEVDMKARTIDMTMRMNARGLLGLFTIPLRPFYHMFQFRGTGPLKDTKWENVIFTAPGAQQQELLLSAPKAKVVREDKD